MTPSTTPSSPVRLGIPRHLQDCNGYCGPACVMMVHSGSNNAVESQHQMFRRVRDHARQSNDRRPVKSPAESLLALLNTGDGAWEKLFRTEPGPVATRIVQAVEQEGRPCLLLISKGMHWVVAFGRTLRDDGSVAGVLLRDPAWAGMPKFFGLTTMPDQPTFRHTAADPCPCLASNNPPGSVHERYMALEELLSPRGLQGSPDWEGKGALALVPVLTKGAAAAVLAVVPAERAALSGDPRTAALEEARAHGLHARPDWKQVLDGGQPGEPILVKDPADSRDDFYLVPVQSSDVALRRTAWIMLDPTTLRLREASLLNDWTAPAFPTDKEAEKIENHDVTLPDGTRHRFQKNKLKPNQRNLVWQASAASILPYWPVKEFTAPHPVTGERVSVYMTQHGEVCSLSPVDTPANTAPAAKPSSAPPPSMMRRVLPLLCAIGGVAAGMGIAALRPLTDTGIQREIATLKTELEIGKEKEKCAAAVAEAVRIAEEKWRIIEKEKSSVAVTEAVRIAEEKWQLLEKERCAVAVKEAVRITEEKWRILDKERCAVAVKEAARIAEEKWQLLEKERCAATVKDAVRIAEEKWRILEKERCAAAVKDAVRIAEEKWQLLEKERCAAAVKDAIRTTDEKWRKVTDGLNVKVKQLSDELEKYRRETKGKGIEIDSRSDKKPGEAGPRLIPKIPNALPKPDALKPDVPSGPKPPAPSEIDPRKKTDERLRP